MTISNNLKFFQKRIIIGGLPRSGSTLLRFILDASDDIISGPETNFFLLPLSDTQLRLDRLALKLSNKLDINEDIIKSCIMNQPSSIQAFDCIMCNYLDPLDKNTIAWAEKTPRNCFHYHRLFEEDRDLYFISTIRNGLDVITSEFEKDDKRYQQRRYWVSIQQYVDCMKAIYSFDKGNHLIINYEKLCRNPEATLEKIFNFIGINFSHNILKKINNFSRTRDPKKVCQPKLVYPIQDTWIDRWKAPDHTDVVATFLSNKDAIYFFKKGGYSIS
jgi:hypothetical protein